MANHYLPGERDEALFEPAEPSWRPEDPDRPDERSRPGYRDPTGGDGELRDARRWDSDEEYEGGYDRPRERPEASGRWQRDRRPSSAGSFEDRHRELGAVDPWGYVSPSAYRGRDFEPERRELSAIYGQRTGYAGAPRGRGGWRRGGAGDPAGDWDERLGEPAGSYGRESADAPGAAREIHAHRGTGPHRGKGPAGYQRSDERIRELVCESLTDDDQIDASRVEVGVSGGEVTLSGAVDDRGAKRAAEDCAYSVSGVRDVQNRLCVRGDRASSNPSDAGAVSLHETQSSAPRAKRGA